MGIKAEVSTSLSTCYFSATQIDFYPVDVCYPVDAGYTPSTGIYLFKLNNRNIIAMREVCSKLTIKTSEKR